MSKSCLTKPTKYQPTDEEFNCPKCGAGVPIFHIDESACHDDCTKVHDSDTLRCDACYRDGRDYDASGKAFAAGVVKRNGLVVCVRCAGKGVVKKANV